MMERWIDVKSDRYRHLFRFLLTRRALSLWIAAIVGITVCLESRSYLSTSRHPINEARVLVAKRPVSAGSMVQFLDFGIAFSSEITAIPPEAVMDQDWHLLRGRRLKVDLGTDEVLTWRKLDEEKNRGISQWIPKGYRAYPFATDRRVLALPGDRVDLIVQPSRSSRVAETVIEAALVLQKENRGEGTQLMLALTPAEVETTETAKSRGRLTASVRSADEGEPSNERKASKRLPNQNRQRVEVLSEVEG